MYVIFPAEEVVDLSLGIVTNPRPVRCHHQPPVPRDPPIREIIETTPEKPKARAKETKKKKKKLMKKGTMAAGGGEATLRDLTHPSVNEALKAHNSVTFKLVKTVSDFTQQLSQVYEQHAEELQLLVSNFRKRNAELRKERPACPSSLFHTWETLLQEVEVDSQAHQDIACILGRQVARPLLERSFHRKIQSRKVFAYRDSYEAILAKAEEKLAKTRQEYKASYAAYSSNPSAAGYAAYLDCHNAYVQQLHATNAMIDTYAHNTLPALLQELEEVYSDLCSTLSESVLQGAEIISTRAVEQGRRYDGLSAQCRAVLGPSDLAHFARSLNAPPAPSMAHKFAPPLPPPPQDALDGPQGPDTPVPEVGLNPPPSLKNELVVDRLASVNIRGRLETLKKEQLDLEGQIKQLKDALDTLLRLQQRSLESNLFNKANELQEDINMKRFDIRVAQIHLAAVKAQKELFATKSESTSDSGRERKMSSSSTGSMKNKWLKAFKSLKTTSGPNNGFSKDGDKKNGKDRDSGLLTPNLDAGTHLFQEYTYKKITPCDACSQILRGHTRQGLRCRICKTNVHADCQDKAARCQAKSRLLRRQKSTSEIETRLQEPPIEDEIPHSPGCASGTRPFGQPLCLTETISENGSFAGNGSVVKARDKRSK